jgi:hypothetical protein
MEMCTMNLERSIFKPKNSFQALENMIRDGHLVSGS